MWTDTDHAMQRFPTHMVLNGVTRRVILESRFRDSFNPRSGTFYGFYLDNDTLPGRPCSHHSLHGVSLFHIINGGSVITSGNTYGGKANVD